MNNELKHHGILGQKWGVRRYQNEDGSLTKAGKTRYEKSDDRKEYEKLSKKPVSAMSNAELSRYNNRAQLEANYNNLNKQNISAGKAFLSAVAIGAATTVAVKLVSNGMEYAAKQGFIKGGKAIGKALTKNLSRFSDDGGNTAISKLAKVFSSSAIDTTANILFKNKK